MKYMYRMSTSLLSGLVGLGFLGTARPHWSERIGEGRRWILGVVLSKRQIIKYFALEKLQVKQISDLRWTSLGRLRDSVFAVDYMYVHAIQ